MCSFMLLFQGAGVICVGDERDSTEGYLYLLSKLNLPEARAGRKVFGKPEADAVRCSQSGDFVLLRLHE